MVALATVYVLPRIPGKGVPQDVRRAIDARIPMVPVYRKDQWTQGIPDFYLRRTRTNMDELWQAARMGITWVVHLQDQGEWFVRQVTDRIHAGQDVWIYQRQQSGGDYPWG